MNEHVLITGGAGFIGGYLTRHLIEHNYQVSVVDLEDNHSVNGHSFVGNLLDTSFFEAVLVQLDSAGNPVDRVIHLAAQVGREFGEDDIRHTIRENAEMTAVVAKACANHEIPLVYTSTSEIYGDWGEQICMEDGEWRLPHNLYGLTKRWGEEVAKLYWPWGLIIWRPSMPYGPGAPPGRGRRAMDNFVWHAQHGREITVHKGSERSWCYIDDTVRAMRMTIEKAQQDRFMSDIQSHMPKAYNIGRDDDPISMLDLAHKICEKVGADKSLIKVVEPPVMQTTVKRLSTEKIRVLGWRPEVELDEGLDHLIEWISDFDADGKHRSLA